MPKKIDWMYERKSCQTCQKARDFLDGVEGKVSAREDATKIKYPAEEAKKLLEGMTKLIALKGTKIVVFDLKKSPPDDETLFSHLIGPTGNLRAPTVKVGKTLVVGFNEEGYRDVLGI
jgi:arsenate reductase-like glutaredoxin family protein